MASKLFPATPRPKIQKGAASDTDKTPPAVKPGASMFGENSPKAAERRASKLVGIERRTPSSRGADLHQAQEELAKVKEQLALVEKSKSNLMQDFARSKRHVEDLTAKLHEANEASKRDKLRAEEIEHASFTAAEDWQGELDVMKQQYEAALIDLQTNKQAMESLKHELAICVEAKDEAVRLAGEAMNAAESTAKRVEELSAELLLTKGSLVAVDSAASRMDELMNELNFTRHSLAEATVSREKIAQEGADMLAAKEADLKEIAEAASSARVEIEGLKKELALAKSSELQLADLTSTLENLKSELAAVKEAEKKNSMVVADTHADSTRVKSEIEQAKKTELMALASLAKVSAELEEAQESLVKATVEGATLGTCLEALKTEFERSLLDVVELREREANANVKAARLSAQLTELMELKRAELELLKERESSAFAAVKGLKEESEKQKLEVMTLTERERIANMNSNALTAEVERNRKELVELQQRESSSVARAAALTRELESSQVELLSSKERESTLASKTACLTSKLEQKELEIAELRDRASTLDSKATALSIELTTLTETNHMNMLDLKEREECANAKAATLDAELARLKQDLEEALTVGKAVKEELDNLRVSLKKTTLDTEQARTEAQVARAEAEQYKKDMVVELAKAQAAKDEVQAARQAAHASELEVHIRVEETKCAKADSQVAREEAELAKREAELVKREVEAVKEKLHAAIEQAQMARKELEVTRDEALSARKEVETLKAEIQAEKEQANAARIDSQTAIDAEAAREEVTLARGEAEAAKEKLHAAMTEAQMASTEVKVARKEAQSARAEVESLKTDIQVEKEQAKAAREESQAAIAEVEKLKRDLENSRLDVQEAQTAWNKAENRLQDAIKEVEILKVNSATVPGQRMNMETQDIADLGIVVLQEELASLKMKLKDTEECLANAMREIDASKSSNEELLKELEVAKVEREINKRALLEVHQHLADTEKAKSVMEAEIQRLLDDSKQRQTAKDAIDISVHPEMNGNSILLESREEKPQPDPLGEVMDTNLSLLDKDEEEQKEEVNHKEENLKEEVTLLPAKKKKKALLHRLGSYLEKKKNQQVPTP